MKRIYLSDTQVGLFRREGKCAFLARTGLAKGGSGSVICGDEYLVAESYEELQMRFADFGKHTGWRDRRYSEGKHLKHCRVVRCRVVEVDAERLPVMSDDEWTLCGVCLDSREYARAYAKSVLRDDRRREGELDKDLVLIEIVRVSR